MKYFLMKKPCTHALDSAERVSVLESLSFTLGTDGSCHIDGTKGTEVNESSSSEFVVEGDAYEGTEPDIASFKSPS